MISEGDLCEVINAPESRLIGIVGLRVRVLAVYAEQLMLTDDSCWLKIDCEVMDVDGWEYWGHTDLLRRIPPDCDAPAAWAGVWQPPAVLA